MKVSYKLSVAAIVASLSLVGCGSSSVENAIDEVINDVTGDATVTGQFVDTYVSGLNYSCTSGTTGITNNMGEYTCLEGDTVEFSLGGYVLGSATASSGIVTPEDIQPNNPDAALNVAQLLQTLDTDPTDDIITIAENFTDLDDVTIALDDELFDDLMETELGVALVTEDEAQIHLDEAELAVLLAGNTLYFKDYETDDTGVKTADVYGNVTFSDTELTLNEIYVDVDDGSMMKEGPVTLPYTLVDGKIRIDLTQFQEGYAWFALSFKTADALNFNTEDDENKDGIIDAGSYETETWFLSQPANFPTSL